MTKRRKLALHATAVAILGVVTLAQPKPSYAAYREDLSGCGVCTSSTGGQSILDFCWGNSSTQDAACQTYCGSFAAQPDCGTSEGDAGCNAGDIGWDCF